MAPEDQLAAGHDHATGLRSKVRFVRRGIESIADYGIMTAIRLTAFEVFYEAKFHSNTAGMVPLDELDLEESAKQHGRMYLPSPYYIAHKAFRLIKAESDMGAFVDFGCGLGRMLFFASQFPFDRIIGVEVAPALAAAATDNLATYYARRGQQRPEWEVVLLNAAAYAIPDDGSVFYFNDPFDERVLDPVVRNIVDSQAQRPRPVFAVYINPAHRDVFTEHGFGVLHSEVNDAGKGFIVYSRGAETKEI